MKYTIYHLVANQGGRYTKHIYIGGERIVSKIGDFASYGPDPRRIEYAGSEADAVTVDYDVKYSQQLQAIKDNYATFGVPYNGTDNDDYVNGEGFCCDDGSLEAAQAKAVAKANALDGNFQEGDAYENLQFYYHADHLGSTSYITNLDGEVVQHVEYVPFGEVFIEERNNTWNTPYLFNAKEFDEETGLYYYGERYYDPKLSLWMSADPMMEKYPSLSPYSYTFNNPIRLKDYKGEETITAIIEGVTAFGFSAGVDFISNWIIEGKDFQTAFRSVSWGAAAVDGLVACGISVFVSGAGTAKTMAKIANSKAGKITIDIVKTMVTIVISKFENGDYNSFKDINLKDDFMEATITSLVSNKMGKRADELLESLKNKNATLYNRLAKLKRNLEAGKNKSRINSDAHKVDVARSESMKAAGAYVKEEAKSKLKTEVTSSLIPNESKDKERK